MKKHCNAITRMTWLFITGSLTGACEKPAVHSTTPESAPTPGSNTSAAANDRLTASMATATDAVPDAPNTSTSTANPLPGWPGASADNGASASSTNTLGSSTFQGCLSKPVTAQNNPTRSTRAKVETTFRVTPLGNGALVTHAFEHACCLSATTDTKVNGSTISIREHLVGAPCRCVCDSTIQTRLNAPPGDYEVRVLLNINGAESLVGVQPLAIKKLIDRSP